MGFDAQSIRFLRYCHETRQKLGKTITIGRQEIDPYAGRDINNGKPSGKLISYKYCEEILVKNIGSSSVDSIDISSYEKASILHDMNQPLPRELCNKWDTVIDGGSLEHIYHFPQAMDNCSRLCRTGGQIIHFVPGNNFLNHGFYQFSPDLFYQLYSPENGYEDTEVFMTEIGFHSRCYKVNPPTGKRSELMSGKRILLMVCTKLEKKNDEIKVIYQKDYQVEWAQKSSLDSWWKNKIKQVPVLHRIIRFVVESARDRARWISPSNRNLKRVRI